MLRLVWNYRARGRKRRDAALLVSRIRHGSQAISLEWNGSIVLEQQNQVSIYLLPKASMWICGERELWNRPLHRRGIYWIVRFHVGAMYDAGILSLSLDFWMRVPGKVYYRQKYGKQKLFTTSLKLSRAREVLLGADENAWSLIKRRHEIGSIKTTMPELEGHDGSKKKKTRGIRRRLLFDFLASSWWLCTCLMLLKHVNMLTEISCGRAHRRQIPRRPKTKDLYLLLFVCSEETVRMTNVKVEGSTRKPKTVLVAYYPKINVKNTVYITIQSI